MHIYNRESFITALRGSLPITLHWIIRPLSAKFVTEYSQKAA